MSEPRRSTRARAREEAAPVPETPKEKEAPAKGAKSTLKRKRTSVVVKEVTPSTPVNEATPQEPKQTLPLRILEGQPLPTLPEPQPLELPVSEWQDIQQSGVLGASLERSRAVWISGVNFRVFHKYFTQPKKPADRTEEDKAKNQRQKDLFKNFPELGRDINNTKDTVEIQAQLVIEPHTFPIRLYAPREVIKHTQKKAPVPTYGHWPNHHVQAQQSHPNQYTQYNNHGQQSYQQRPPAPKPPPPPKPVQKPPQPTPGPASQPAPDPVIHALAQRAGTDPELKSVMKIVAAGQANKAQLEFFQNHINELTAMLAKQKETPKPSAPPATPSSQTSSTPKPALSPAASKPLPQPAAAKAPSQSPAAPTPAPVVKNATTPAVTPRSSSAATSTPTPAPAPVPSPAPIAANTPKSVPNPAPTPAAVPPALPRPVQPAQHQQPMQYAPKPYSPVPPQGHMQQPPPMRPPHAPYPNNYGHPPPQYHPPRQMTYHAPPQPTGYRPLVFSFEEGNKDLLHFPSYSFMEWLPNMSGAKFSFLVTKLKPKAETDAAAKPSSTPAPKSTPTPAPAPGPTQQQIGPQAATPGPSMGFPTQGTPVTGAPATPATPTPYVPPPRIEDFDEKNDVPEIDFYQPVTVLLLTENNDIRQALLRAIRPPDVVEKYMDEVFDKCKRAEETYLAFRLPKDGDAEIPEKRARSGDGTPVVATPLQETTFGASSLQSLEKKKAGRPRKSLV